MAGSGTAGHMDSVERGSFHLRKNSDERQREVGSRGARFVGAGHCPRTAPVPAGSGSLSPDIETAGSGAGVCKGNARQEAGHRLRGSGSALTFLPLPSAGQRVYCV